MERVRKKHKENQGKQVAYLGRYVDYYHFRVFVYNKEGESKLADSYEKYTSLVSSGLWFSTLADAEKVSGVSREPEEPLTEMPELTEIEETKMAEAREKIKKVKQSSKIAD